MTELPKVYEAEYGLHTEWISYGKPEYLFTDIFVRFIKLFDLVAELDRS